MFTFTSQSWYFMLETSDKDFWDRILLDDHSSFGPLYDRYWEEMFSIAYRRLGDEEKAKDIVQDIFIRTWENRHKIVVTHSLAPYLMTALKYSVVREIYRTSQKGYVHMPLSALNIPEEESAYKADWQEVEKLHLLVSEEVSTMPARMQQIFRLNKEQQLSIRDIALQLSISEQTVKNTLHTALKRLRVRLQQQGAFLIFIL